MKKIVLFMLIAFAGMQTAAFAENKAETFTLSPFIGGYTYKVDEDKFGALETSFIYGLRGGYNFTRNWGAELVFHYASAEHFAPGNESVDVYNYRLDALYHFMPEQRFVPFVAAGIGGIRNEFPTSSGIQYKATPAFNYGVGAKYYLTEDVALRADVRHLVMHPDWTMHNVEYTAGLSFAFGGAKPAPAPVAAPVAPPVVQPEPEAPLEPAPAAEPTPEKMKYCISLNIEFDIDKALIRPQYNDEVAKVGDFMKKYPTTTAVIEGYTDEVGSDEHNMHLSQRRAESVVKSLVEKFGIDSSRLSAKGYGKSRPTADNATDAGKQKNRRIDAIIDCAFDVKDLALPPERLCMTLKVEYATDSAEIKSRYYDEVSKIGEYMKKYPTTTAVIEGHTDNIGGSAYNMKLSQKRAENVVNYLVEKFGIERSRLSAKGYGLTRRIAYNNTAEGRQKNRRINAVIDCVTKQ